MWFICVEVEQEASAPHPKKNPGSAPDSILTDKGRNLFPQNLPGHRIIGWKSEDESHVIENFACNSTS